MRGHKYKVLDIDARTIVEAQIVLNIFLRHWSEDLTAKEAHLARLFVAADVDGDGELTTSEFTALIHEVDPEVPVHESMKMCVVCCCCLLLFGCCLVVVVVESLFGFFTFTHHRLLLSLPFLFYPPRASSPCSLSLSLSHTLSQVQRCTS